MIARVVEEDLIPIPTREPSGPELVTGQEVAKVFGVAGRDPIEPAEVVVEGPEPPILIARVVEEDLIPILTREASGPEQVAALQVAEPAAVAGQVPGERLRAAIKRADPPIPVRGVMEDELRKL